MVTKSNRSNLVFKKNKPINPDDSITVSDHPRLFGVIIVALLFGFALAGIEPYPYTYSLSIMVSATIFYLVMTSLASSSRVKHYWFYFGIATFACFIVVYLWLWLGTIKFGWWYPPLAPIIQQIVFIDGERAYDAMVTNLFIVLWFFMSVAFVAHYMTFRPKQLPSTTA